MNCLIIDSDTGARQLLGEFVKKIPYLTLAASLEQYSQALPVLKSNPVDLLIMDILKTSQPAKELLDTIPFKPQLILTSTTPDFAMDAFEWAALDYLLKPVSFERFKIATRRVKEYLDLKTDKTARGKDYFFINASHKLHKVVYDEILYLEGFKDYTKIHLGSAQAPLVILHNLKYFEELLDPQEFIRIHRSYIISIRKVTTVSRKSVIIHSKELPVSDNYRDTFFAIVDLHAR